MLQPTNAMITNATKLLPNGTYLLRWPGYVSLQVTVKRDVSTGGTAKQKKKACACEVPSTGASASNKAPQIKEQLKIWSKSVTDYINGFRKSVPLLQQQSAMSNLWQQSQILMELFGYNIAGWQPTNDLIQESDVWWAQQVEYVGAAPKRAPVLDALSGMAKTVARQMAASASKGDFVNRSVVTAFLSTLLKLIQIEQHLRFTPYSFELRAAKQPKQKKVNPCNPPKKRVGPDVKCNADWDGIVSCVIRSGGLSASDPAVNELIHAAGRRKDLPPKLIQKRGKPWGQIAHVLTEQGFTAPDQHGRPDEQATLETLVEALRGGPRMARMNLCQAERNIQEV